MRATKQATDLEYWANAREYWRGRAEAWFMESAKATGAWAATVAENEKKANARAFAAELAWQEAQGLIECYTGRKNPLWATQ